MPIRETIEIDWSQAVRETDGFIGRIEILEKAMVRSATSTERAWDRTDEAMRRSWKKSERTLQELADIETKLASPKHIKMMGQKIRMQKKLDKAYRDAAGGAGEAARETKTFEERHRQLARTLRMFSMTGMVGIWFMFADRIAGAAKAMYDFAEQSARAVDKVRGFERMGGTMGDLQQMQDALGGTMGKSQIASFAALSKNMGLAKEDFKELAQVAKGATRITGESMGRMMEQITKGTLRKSGERLDDLGIQMGRLEDIYSRVAKEHGRSVDELTSKDRDLIFVKEVLLKSARLKEMAQMDAAGDKYDKVTAAWEDMKLELGMALEKSGLMTKVTNALSGAIEYLGGYLREVGGLLGGWAEGMGLLAGAVANLGRKFGFTSSKAREAGNAILGVQRVMTGGGQSKERLEELANMDLSKGRSGWKDTYDTGLIGDVAGYVGGHGLNDQMLQLGKNMQSQAKHELKRRENVAKAKNNMANWTPEAMKDFMMSAHNVPQAEKDDPFGGLTFDGGSGGRKKSSASKEADRKRLFEAIKEGTFEGTTSAFLSGRLKKGLTRDEMRTMPGLAGYDAGASMGGSIMGGIGEAGTGAGKKQKDRLLNVLGGAMAEGAKEGSTEELVAERQKVAKAEKELTEKVKGYWADAYSNIAGSTADFFSSLIEGAEDWRDRFANLMGELFYNVGWALYQTAAAQMALLSGNPFAAATAAGLLQVAAAAITNLLKGPAKKAGGDTGAEANRTNSLEERRKERQKETRVEIYLQGSPWTQMLTREIFDQVEGEAKRRGYSALRAGG